MPVDVKPLFRPDVLGPKLRSFGLPERVAGQAGVVTKWAGLLGSVEADRFKEQELLPDFLGDVFGKLLGYTLPAENPGRYTLSREQHVELAGRPRLQVFDLQFSSRAGMLWQLGTDVQVIDAG